jgi:hypothetical protein
MTTNRDMHWSFRQSLRHRIAASLNGGSKPAARAALEAGMLSNRRYTRLTFPRYAFSHGRTPLPNEAPPQTDEMYFRRM